MITVPLALFLAALAALAYGGWHYAHAPLEEIGEPAPLVVTPGMSLHAVARELERRQVIPSARGLVLVARAQGKADTIRSGEYQLRPGMSRQDILRDLVQGNVLMHRITLIEGWNFAEVRQALENHEAVDNTLAELPDDELMAALGHEGEHPEGLFFPDTYTFARGTTDRSILNQAYTRMQTVLAREWEQRQPDLPIDTPYEALILASLVEKETGAEHERGQIAGVFVRRLNRGMRLQTDPTAVYGVDDYYGVVRPHHVRRDHPYNTYTRAGLPPTPIAMPGAAAIHAALNPEPGDSLYFVSRRDGTHHFSATLEEHNRAVDRYLRGGRPRPVEPD